ncbi:hypothetical protein CANCADRAFT_111926 [Tortispora caseinolytica NRRL Y-17796]|uniref:Uncharacterized protein n=1 Tax=Tortispora caseinolytica NRRL Y-17796 TaxID=767744 RepID=A0A1E4TGE0_9ASCO|nr:hypothetical protein CANCADRAFT_111926 [Tortispora caseinolytica NRRL Y-17796]
MSKFTLYVDKEPHAPTRTKISYLEADDDKENIPPAGFASISPKKHFQAPSKSRKPLAQLYHHIELPEEELYDCPEADHLIVQSALLKKSENSATNSTTTSRRDGALKTPAISRQRQLPSARPILMR